MYNLKNSKLLIMLSVLLMYSTLTFSQNTQTFYFQGNTFQYYTVPVTGYYQLTARGGQGGRISNYFGGLGSHMQGYFLLHAGEVIKISVAGKGGNGIYGHKPNSNLPKATGGGGGGASSIVRLSGNEMIPLIVAGGGGGASSNNSGINSHIYPDGLGGVDNNGTGTSSGGTNGGGGTISSNNSGGAGGAGFYGDGGTHCAGNCNGSNVLSYGGQAYVSGNYGGNSGQDGGDGGWGGGGEGGTFNISDGGGGGGGGYSGGGGGNSSLAGAGGGGGSYNAALCGRSDSSGVNYGDGLVTITGPNTVTEVVNTPFNPYTWPANGNSYSNAGTYIFTDSANCVTRILDLSFGLQSCTSYDRVDTTVVSCGGFTWSGNGRTYTTNMIDSVRIGCKRYIVRLIVAPPAAVGPIQGVSSGCRNTTATFSVEPVSFATMYQWTLPSGASGSSTTNTITVTFSNQFNGGQIKVAAVNNCGASAIQMKSVGRTLSPPAGRLAITGPSGRISGFYSVNALSNTTSYTWSVSNNQAVIVSGQGTSRIHLEALPGFTYTNLSVVASNCKGNGSRGNISLGTNGGNTCSGSNKIAETNKINDVLSVMPMSVSVFPNPSNSSFNLQVSSTDSKDVSVNIFDLQGRKIKSMTSTPNQNIVFGNDLKAGVYLIEVKQGNLMKTMRVVKY